MSLPVLQVLYRPETLESAINHDGHSGAESLTFFHTEQSYKRLAYIMYTLKGNSSSWDLQKYFLVYISSYLCEVRTTALPSLVTLRMQFQRNLLAFGSMPVVGSSYKELKKSSKQLRTESKYYLLLHLATSLNRLTNPQGKKFNRDKYPHFTVYKEGLHDSSPKVNPKHHNLLLVVSCRISHTPQMLSYTAWFKAKIKL